MVRSASLKRSNLYLRQHRRWPHSPYKTRWHQTFNQQQAMQHLRKSLLLPSQHQQQQQQQEDPTNLLSSLVHSFTIYNCHPTPQAYLFLIKTLANASHFNRILSILHHLENNQNLDIPEWFFTHVIKIYVNADRIQDAVSLFYRIPKFRCVPSVHSLNTLLSVVCGHFQCTKLVPKILLQSQLMNIRLEESTFRLLIGCLCRIKRVRFAIQIFNSMINDGFVVDSKTCSLLLSSVCEQKIDLSGFEVVGFLQDLKRLGFCPKIVDYSNVIRCLVKMEMGLDALGVLNQMKSDGIKPDVVCYTMVLSGVIAAGDYAKAEKVFDELLVLGLVPNVCTYNVYINGLCKQNKVEDGIKMVAYMEELRCKPNVVTYNTILKCLCKVGEVNRSRELVRVMRSKGVAPNLVTYNILIDSLVSVGEVVEVCCLLKEVLDMYSCPPSSMFDEKLCGLCYKGMVSEVLELLKKMADKNVSPGTRVWEALLLSSGSKLDFTDASLINLLNTDSCQNEIFDQQLTSCSVSHS